MILPVELVYLIADHLSSASDIKNLCIVNNVDYINYLCLRTNTSYSIIKILMNKHDDILKWHIYKIHILVDMYLFKYLDDYISRIT